jgi:hypothetical protein
MKTIRTALLCIACSILFYLSWYEWTAALFVAFFFFPAISATIVAISFTFIVYGIERYKDIQARRFEWSTNLICSMIWFVTIIITCVMIDGDTWWLYIPLVIVIILLIPPILSDVALLLFKGIALHIRAEGAIGGAWLTLNIIWIYFLLRFRSDKRQRSNSNGGTTSNGDATSTMDEEHQR